MNKNEAITKILELGVLVSPEFFENIPEAFDYVSFLTKARQKLQSQSILIESDLNEIINESKNNSGLYVQQLSKQSAELTIGKPEITGKVIIKKNYTKEVKKKDVQSFVSYFRRRYDSLRKILMSRQELQDSLSISRLQRKEERQSVSVIGLVLDKSETKNGNIRIKMEDTTGTIDVIINKTKPDLFEIAKDLVLDEIIGITGITGNKIIFCNSIFLPEIPVNHEFKKAPGEGYAVFISDIHFGIKNFLDSDFMKFISWLSGEFGTKQQREIANKVKYLFVTGDIVEGVGIYPGQELDLEIKDIYAQYEEATRYFKMIPERIKVIMCGGNHDAIRMSEPQPVFDKQMAKGLYNLPNLLIVSNPAVVNIDSTDNFPGFDVLMYHGFSFPYYTESVPSLRSKGGLKKCDLIMKFLLQRRHLAPSHGSTLYVPDDEEDSLVIDIVPDIFVSGHIHQITIGNYRNVSLINSSCWVVQSEDNAKRGIIPEPAKIPIINLQTREVKIMNFLSDGVKVLVEERLAAKTN